MNQKVIILDFGSQYTQLIARSLRELHVYCEIQPYNQEIADEKEIIGVIFSGSPCSVLDVNAPKVDVASILRHYPVLGICFGAQMTAQQFGGVVAPSEKREYGAALLDIKDKDASIFRNIPQHDKVWMSHADSILEVPDNAKIIASTKDIPVAAYRIANSYPHNFIGLQFHPEVVHSEHGQEMIKNFLQYECHANFDWTASSFVDSSVKDIKHQVGDGKVLMALSGGVDSTVAAGLIHKAIGDRLTCLFVDNGLLRYQEYDEVLKSYKDYGFNVIGLEAKDRFYKALKDVSDPEEKRKIIGNLFIEIFQEEANKMDDVDFLGQGTIYPDVIESVSVAGPSVTIKSHHNVGGLPEKMNLKLVEPLRNLFKDEVREIGREIGIGEEIIGRHPFPGPGLAIRIIGPVSAEKVELLQKADYLFIKGLKENNLYDEVWQALSILLPVQSVGVMGDERTYEYTLALRAVTSRDGMTADWVRLPYDFLAELSNNIINSVKGINRVVYDISSKPPATIEWE